MMYPESGSKRHAVRKDDPDSPLYWVGNDADWREVRREPRIPLECPERCGVELVSVESPAYQHTPRFFRIKPPRRAITGSRRLAMAGGKVRNTTG
jgi:hypothetical protein